MQHGDKNAARVAAAQAILDRAWGKAAQSVDLASDTLLRIIVQRPGFRSPDWLEVPIRHREEFVVVGYLPSPRGFSTLILLRDGYDTGC
ncbi:MAG TPA: hypothetical protein VKT83_03960 [bacterium]|nr:hypothetical protein [bacterium]